jgi:hypothetical protein
MIKLPFENQFLLLSLGKSKGRGAETYLLSPLVELALDLET